MGPVIKHWQHINKEILTNHLLDNPDKILKYLYKESDNWGNYSYILCVNVNFQDRQVN